jgi:predicted PurR-regulated permease PerM
MKENPLLHRNDDFKVKTRDIRVVKLLVVLVILATLYTLYFAQSLIIPVVFSMLVALLLSPLVTKLKLWYVPRSISSIVLLSMLIAPLLFLIIELSEPVERWIKLLPQISTQVTEHMTEISGTFENDRDDVNDKEGSFFSWFEDDEVAKVQEENMVEEQLKQGSTQLLLNTLIAAPIFLAQALGSIILTLFLLIFGPPLFRVIVNDFPIIKNKRRAKTLIKSIQQALSRYILTISIINSGLGALTAISLAYFGIRDAMLWGAIVGALNFVPYLGSIVSVAILSLVGAVQFGITATAMLPPGLFITFNILESQMVTPAVLSKSMQINPLIIILWLLLSGWLWGILGVLLAVPIFVCIKLALEQLEVFPHWLKLIEARD